MRLTAALFIFAIFIAGCSEANRYVGKWQNGANQLQLLKDGTAIAEEKKGTMTGTWKPDDDGGVIVTLTYLGMSVVARGHIEGRDFVLVHDGKSIRYAPAD